MTPFPADAQDHRRLEHGVTLFYTTDTPVEDLTGTKIPEVYGGELIIFWHEIEPNEGEFDWPRLDRDFAEWHAAGKKLDIRLSTAHVSPIFTPRWVYANHHVRRIGRGIFENFEGEAWRYTPGPNASVTTNPDHVFSGSRALLVDQSGNPEGTFLTLDGPPLDRNTLYSIQWDYLPLGGADIAVEVINQDGEVQQRFQVSPDREGWNVANVEVELDHQPGQRIRLVANDDSRFAVDNMNIIRITPEAPFRTTDMQSGEIEDWIVAEGEEPYWGEVFRPILANDPVNFPLRQGDGLQVRLRLDATMEGELRLVVRSRSNHQQVFHDQVVPVQIAEDQTALFHLFGELPDDDQEILILYRGPGSFQVNQAAWRRWTDQVTTFPDYFSPDFNRLWERLVGAFAERYAGHPALGIVSVGGFGRWEEVMLDEDIYGALDDQWFSRHFSEEAYLDQVVHSMDLYRRIMPDADLRICLAYGLQHGADVDWIYRRTAQAAVARGIGLKQNGLSEKYDSWNSNTNTSYLYHLYRDNESIGLTHETGGQIYRNLADAHGYPLSLLNRTAANYTNHLFLYFNDIHGRHIRKYFHTHLEHSRRTRTTNFYSWLGDTSMVHEHRNVPVPTQNRWYGLRQFDGPGQTPVKTDIDGERVMQTSASNRRIVFDVDDRFQYHGLFGAELSIDYYDYPAGPFQVEVYDNPTHGWRQLGTVKRTGEKRFQRAFFYDDQWNRSSRHGGEDIHADVVIKEPTGTGPLSVRNVELNFVTAREWQTRPLLPSLKADRGRIASEALSADLPARPQGSYPAIAQVKLHSPGLDRATALGRLYAIMPEMGRERLVAEKEFYIPADGDILDIPFTPIRDASGYRVELTALEGSIGWYESDTGDPLIQLLAYESAPIEHLPRGGATLSAGQTIQGTITTDQPLHELGIHFMDPAPGAQVNIRVRRHIPGGGWSVPLVDIQRHLVASDGPLTLPLELQTPGRFKVEVVGHWMQTGVGVTDEGDLYVAASYLLPAKEDRPPRPVTLNETRHAIESPSDWTVRSGLEVTGGQESRAYRITDFEPRIELPISLDANSRQRIIVRMRNSSGSNMARLYWAAEGEPYQAGNSFLLPLVPNDSHVRDYAFPVGLEAGWESHIDRLLLKPVVGATRHGEIELSGVFIDEDRIHTDLDFRRPLDHLVAVRGVRELAKEDDGLHVTLSEEKAVLRVPLQDFNVETAPELGGEKLTVRLRNNSSATTLRVMWHTPQQRFLNPGRAFQSDRHPFIEIPIHSHSNAVREYEIQLSDHSEWKGHIVALAVAPAVGAVEGESVLIESLKIRDSDAIPE